MGLSCSVCTEQITNQFLSNSSRYLARRGTTIAVLHKEIGIRTTLIPLHTMYDGGSGSFPR